MARSTSERSQVHWSAVWFCGVAAVALVAAVVLFATTGPPYGLNIGAGALYVVGLLAGLIGAVLLWLAWAELRADVSPGRLRWGVTTAMGSLVLVCACPVMTIANVISGNAQLGLMSAAALVLVVAVAALAQARAA